MLNATFLPLKFEWFDAYALGLKSVEFRRYGRRFNEAAFPVGRAVVLSRGYSGARRLAIVTAFHRLRIYDVPDAARAIYPDCDEFAAIHLLLIKRETLP